MQAYKPGSVSTVVESYHLSRPFVTKRL